MGAPAKEEASPRHHTFIRDVHLAQARMSPTLACLSRPPQNSVHNTSVSCAQHVLDAECGSLLGQRVPIYLYMHGDASGDARAAVRHLSDE